MFLSKGPYKNEYNMWKFSFVLLIIAIIILLVIKFTTDKSCMDMILDCGDTDDSGTPSPCVINAGKECSAVRETDPKFITAYYLQDIAFFIGFVIWVYLLVFQKNSELNRLQIHKYGLMGYILVVITAMLYSTV